MLPGVKVFLTGHGYAPEIKVTRPDGTVIFDDAVVFLPRDGNLTSSGVVKVPDVEPGFALTGLFLPTATIDPVMGPVSTFPAARDPQLFLGAFTGDVPTGGNVYKLDTSGLDRVGTKALRPGETWTLPDGTEVEFVGYRDFANLSLAHDPGRWLALVAAALVIVGVSMSLLLQRRRVWVRLVPGVDTVGGTVDVAGLSRSGGGRVHEDVAEIVTVVHNRQRTEDETWHN